MIAPAYRPLDWRDAKTLALASLGGALEFYDFVVFVFFATIISQLFFPPGMSTGLKDFQSFGIFAAGYLARPLGGIVMAHFGDIIGRKRMFTLSVFLMAGPTFAIGFLPTFSVIGFAAPALLLALRILQGAAIGGEVPGAWVFASEHVPENRTGLACGALTGGLTAGILAGSLVAAGLTHHFTSAQMLDFGWRLPFLLGGVFGLTAVYLRRWLEETPVFEELRRERLLATRLPVSLVLKDHRRAVVLGMLMTWMLTAAIVVVILMTPTLLQRGFHLSATSVLSASCAGNLGLSLGCVIWGMIIDRIGITKAFAIGGSLLTLLTFLLYQVAQHDPAWLFVVDGATGLCVGVIAVVPVFLVRSFPSAIRFSGISFSYNIAYAVFGGLTTLVIGLLPLTAPPIYVAALCFLGIAVLGFAGRRQVSFSGSTGRLPVSLTAPPSAL